MDFLNGIVGNGSSSNGHRSNGHHSERDLVAIDRMVQRVLHEIGQAQWGKTLVLWAKYDVVARLYPTADSAYWWVAGRGDNGRGYQWDVLLEASRDHFIVGHARGNLTTTDLSEASLRATLAQATTLGPIEQIPSSGYVG